MLGKFVGPYVRRNRLTQFGLESIKRLVLSHVDSFQSIQKLEKCFDVF